MKIWRWIFGTQEQEPAAEPTPPPTPQYEETWPELPCWNGYQLRSEFMYLRPRTRDETGTIPDAEHSIRIGNDDWIMHDETQRLLCRWHRDGQRWVLKL